MTQGGQGTFTEEGGKPCHCAQQRQNTMTRRKLVMGQRSQEEGNSSTMWELPTHWTAAQALAVFEVLDDLRDLVVDGYARKIQQAARLDRTVSTPSPPPNMDDGDVDF